MKEGIGRIDLSDLNKSHYKNVEPIKALEVGRWYNVGNYKGHEIQIYFHEDLTCEAEIRHEDGEWVDKVSNCQNYDEAMAAAHFQIDCIED